MNPKPYLLLLIMILDSMIIPNSACVCQSKGPFLRIMNMPDQYLHMSGSGEPIHFFHANGFPAGVYTPMLNALKQQFDVYALNSRATHTEAGDPEHKNWHVYADDLIEFIETLGKPIIAIGHSMGASSTVLAAVKRPDLFKALVLIEPAMVSLPISMVLRMLPKKMVNDTKLVKGTVNKPDTWSTKEEYESYIRKFKGYSQFSDEAFDAFLDHGIQKTDDAFKLVFHKKWEAYNYTNPPYLMGEFKKLNSLNIPTVAIRGKPNMFFSGKLWNKWQTVQPKAIFLEDKRFSHLYPLESPSECMALITQGLEKLNIQ